MATKNQKIVILYQPPRQVVSNQRVRLHPFFYVFLGLVVVVAMASAVAAVVH